MMNLRETEDQKIYISSDFHLNHDPKWDNPIWKMRGFNSAQEMTDGIIDSVNETVRPNDILIFLGDFCLNTTLPQFEQLIARFNCQNIYMMFGNHPNPHRKNIYKPLVKQILGDKYTENSEVYPLRYKNIIYIGHYAEAILNGQMYILSHFPFMIWDHKQHGAICLTGHSHASCEHTNSKGNYGRILDCGWDEFKRPLSLSEITHLMKDKTHQSIDHH